MLGIVKMFLFRFGKYYVNLQGWRIESTGSVETAKVVEEVQSLGDLPF